MAARVRFLALTLAGFGRYDRPTRFTLDGRSSSFTCANEAGKSTFHAGLLATLFGPPSVKSKFTAFQDRYRSWTKPDEFFGELEFAVGDEQWRVRQDFDTSEVRVWRIASDGSAELHYESRFVKARKTNDSKLDGPDPAAETDLEVEPRVRAKPVAAAKPASEGGYAELLNEWLAMDDRSLYEAMFTISQETTLATSWQIDPRIAERVYGPAVDRITRNLMELYDRFRAITRNTREYQVAIGSQGERNGRSDGRLDEVVVKINELETILAAAEQRLARVVAERTQLEDVERTCELLRQQIADTNQSLEHWNAWVELESRLRPAVESYERLNELNALCQQVTRPLAELRARLAGEFAIFDQAPDDLAEQLEYYPLRAAAVEEAERKLADAQSAVAQTHAELARLENEFLQLEEYYQRPGLADQIEELRLVNEEIECVQRRVADLDETPNEIDDPRRAAIARRDQLLPWQKLGADWQQRLTILREQVGRFRAEHTAFLAHREQYARRSETAARLEAAIARFEIEREEFGRRRERERATLLAARHAAEQAHINAIQASQQLEADRADVERRFIDFAGAPSNLLQLWDELHATEAEQLAARQALDAARYAEQQVEARIYWRRGLTVFGGFIALLCIVTGDGWTGWLTGLAAGVLAGGVLRIYRTHPNEVTNAKTRHREADAHQTALSRRLAECSRQLGPFVVPREREAEWRRLWPAYERELQRLHALTQSLPTDQAIAQLAEAASDATQQLAKQEAEAIQSLDVLDNSLARSRAELDACVSELPGLAAALAEHVAAHFATPASTADSPNESASITAGATAVLARIDAWQSQPVCALASSWHALLELAELLSHSGICSTPVSHSPDQPMTIVGVVNWCLSLPDDVWERAAQCCSELTGLETELAVESPAKTAKRIALAEAKQLLESLQLQAMQLEENIAPYTSETDPIWLRSREDAAREVSRQLIECRARCERLPDPTPLAGDLEDARQNYARATALLAPFFERFGTSNREGQPGANDGNLLNSEASLPPEEPPVDNLPAMQSTSHPIMQALRERDSISEQLRKLEKEAKMLLAGSGFTSLEELAHESGKAEGLVGTIRASSQELLAHTEELWEAVDAPPQLATERVAELERKLRENTNSLHAAERHRAELVASIKHLEADPNNDVDAFRRELETLRAERTELEQQRDQIAAEFQEADRLRQQLEQVERTALEGRITAYFSDFSRTAHRRIELDEELRIMVKNDDGTRYHPTQLSHGARDQLYLAVYFATTAGFDLPFVLDDPFVNCDDERLAAIRACWDRLIPDHQLILLSHDSHLAAWAPALQLRQAA